MTSRYLPFEGITASILILQIYKFMVMVPCWVRVDIAQGWVNTILVSVGPRKGKAQNDHVFVHMCVSFWFMCFWVDAISKLYSFKGALDKYNIYIFISNSIEEFNLNQYRNFQLILPKRFHFMSDFVNIIISRVSHRQLYCVFIEVDFEK